jgi:hypothetical protein
MGALFSDATRILTEIYLRDEIADLVYREHAFLADVTKVDDFYGVTEREAIKIGAPDATSANPDVAYGTGSSAGTMIDAYGAFTGTQFALYNRAILDRQAVMACSTKEALSNLLEDATDLMLEAMGNRMAQWNYGNATSSVASYASNSGEVWTLTNPDDAAKFFRNQEYQVYNGSGPSLRTITAAAGYSPLGAGTAIRVASVDEDAGTVTFTAGDTAAVGSLTAGDFLLPSGDTGGTGAWPGLASWIPKTAPTSTTFFGQDRTKGGLRLSGVRLDKPTQRITASIRKVGEKIKYVTKRRPDKCYIHPLNFTAMVEQEKLHQHTMEVTLKSGFSTVQVMIGGGSVDVVSDPDCPLDTGYVITSKTWKIRHMGGLPHLVDDGGGQLMQPLLGTNSFMIKGAAYGWLVCNAPGANGTFTIG